MLPYRIFIWPELKPLSGTDKLEYWRNRVLYLILLTSVALGMAAYIPSVWLSLKEDLIIVAVIDTAVYLYLLYLFFSRRLTYQFRAVNVTILCYLVGLILLWVIGPFGAGPVWLFAFPVLAGILLDYKSTVITLFINALTIVSLGGLIWAGIWTGSHVPAENTVSKWVVIFLNFITLNAASAISITAIIDGLKSALVEEERLRKNLQDNQKELKKVNQTLKTEIIERKSSETKRIFLQNQLEQSQKLESVGQLAGGIAHDFNNMLGVILGYGEELLHALRPTDPLREYAQEILQAGKRSAELTRQLLAFSRRQRLQPEMLDLNLVVKNIEKVLRRIIGEDIELATLLSRDLSFVRVDPGQMEQVIVNLAVNARDAMPQGGKLAIETSNIELDDQYASTHVSVNPGRYVMIAVTDTGCGMTEEIRAKIFEPFFTTKTRDKGTGLGLSTVYGIVKQSGGNIWVYSESGHGTTFKIYLPETIDSPSARKAPRGDLAVKGNGEMVLVVEDEPSVRRLCETTLKSLNYRVAVAANGKEALSWVEEKKLRPDLVITDVVMPQMSGKVLTGRLKTALPGLKVLFMSGYADNTIVHHGILDCAAPFIQKPFTKTKLAVAVRGLLDNDESPTGSGMA